VACPKPRARAASNCGPGLDRAVQCWHRSMAQAGYGALHWPPEYGGAGRPIGHQLAQIEELAKTGTDAKVLMAGLYLVAPVLRL
jgi:alkylation response protein AidB-like acyl-CoA dehydrogenase